MILWNFKIRSGVVSWGLYCSIHTYNRIEVDIGRRYIENHAAASFRFVSPGIN
jgi:hypothetical protein